MIRWIRPQEIIKTEQFVREPVDSLSKKIITTSSQKIIVNGGRGSGKSLVLLNTQDKGLGTENQTILMPFESIVSLSTKPNELFTEKFLNHYYELVFSWKLLAYIKNNYILTYDSNFKDIEALLQKISRNTDDYINNIYYEKKELERYLSPKEISSEIIERLKKCLDINTLNLAIDRFDWINGSSAYTQQILSTYFDMFDKTIITTDDLSLTEQGKQREFEDKGYSFITTEYGKNVDVIKQIIQKRLKLFNSSSKKSFNENIITTKIYNNLVEKASGNISVILDTLGEVADLLEWQDNRVENIENEFASEIDNQLDKIKQLKKIDATPPQLHL